MNRDNERQSAIILSVIGIIPVVWLALLIAPSVKGGLPEIMPSLLTAFNEPFHIELCEDSLKTVLVLLLCYGMGIGIYFSTQKNYRRREEHGSAKWGNVEKCKELSLYDIGVTAEYGDKILTLSTCEYSRTNGRLVVVAKLINE